jgi:hypothetical protein
LSYYIFLKIKKLLLFDKIVFPKTEIFRTDASCCYNACGSSCHSLDSHLICSFVDMDLIAEILIYLNAPILISAAVRNFRDK